jgi:6-phosphogluconolactonase
VIDTVIDTLIADAPTLGEALAADFAAEGARAIAARGRFTVAIPGGSVASTFFPRLAQLSFDWSRTEFFWTDERAVPPHDPESNYGVAHSLWLQTAGVAASQIHRMPADRAELETAAREYAEELKRVAGDPPVLDFVLLGVGEDGHVASLFPGRTATTNGQALAAAVVDAPKPPRRRMTLTLPVLTSARRDVVAALGHSKAAALRDGLEGRDSGLPIASVLHRSARLLLLLDPDAARHLTGAAQAPGGKPPRP